MTEKPIPTNSASAKALDKAEASFTRHEEQIKSLTVDELNKTPLQETEPQTKLSNREINKFDAKYMKPSRTIGSREPFNEKYRAQWDEKKQYVRCVVENNEIIGEAIKFWSKPFAGIPAEFWEVPVNTPIMLPRHCAEQLARKFYHRLVMDEKKIVEDSGDAVFYGAMVSKETRRRIDCRPAQSSFVAVGF
jgi:hypothetical protein